MPTLFASGSNWGTASDFGLTSGASDSSVPTASDPVIFDGNSVSMAIDVNAVCLTIDTTGYTATLTQNNTFTLTISGTLTWAAGTFVGGDSAIQINNGSFIQSGGTFTNSSGGMTLDRDLTRTGGVFTDSGTITINGASNADDTIITSSGSFGGTIVFNVVANDANLTVAAGTSINLGTDPSSIIASGLTNNGTIIIDGGTWTVSSQAIFTNNGTFTHNGTGWDSGGTLNNTATGTITYIGTALSFQQNFTQNGTFDLTGKTITFDGGSGASDTILLSGSTPIEGNIVINKTAPDTDFTIGSNVTIQGNFTRTNGPVINPSSAFTLTIEGNFSMSTTDLFGGANLTLDFSGSNDQTFAQNAGTFSGEFTVNKSGGTLTLTTDFTNATSRDVTVTSGHLCTNGNDMTIDDVLTIIAGAILTRVTGDTITAGTTVGTIRDAVSCALPAGGGAAAMCVIFAEAEDE